MWFQKKTWKLQQSGKFVIFVIFYSLFLDNMLLTVIVPIVPEFLNDVEDVNIISSANASFILPDGTVQDHDVNKSHWCNSTLDQSCITKNWHKTSLDIMEENDEIGLLFSSKALVQLVANPLAGMMTSRIGYRAPLFIGCLILLISSLVFAFGQTYGWLLAARSVQGLGSACISVSGMAMIADHYQDDKDRSRNMGIALGGIAVGVLVGYPFGGVMYNFFGKTAPFLAIFSLLLIDIVVQLTVFRPRLEPECNFPVFLCKETRVPNSKEIDRKPKVVKFFIHCDNKASVIQRLLIGASIMKLMCDPYILLTAGAIFVSTCVMSTLEPCLPIWLMKMMSPPKWQLGTVFIPDSLGYLVGTTLFGSIAFRIGRWLTAMLSLILVGICSITIPFSTHILQLVAPHLGLGLGIGIIDASMMPLLAYLVDTRYATLYGSVYTIAQLAVSLAYCLGPLVGGELLKVLGFPWLMRGIGIINLVYCPLCYFLRQPPGREEGKAINLKGMPKQDAVCEQIVESRILYSTFDNQE